MKKIDFKQYLPEIIILAVFIIVSAIYFYPALSGKIIYAGDNVNANAARQEVKRYVDETGDNDTYWTGAMFSGMPSYQIGGFDYLNRRLLAPFYWFFYWGTRNTAVLMLFYLLAFYCLLRTFKVGKWLSLAGAFAITFSSYFFVIIAAQHHAKCVSITWMTLVLVGFMLIFRKQYGIGALLVMLFVPMGFFIHPQMAYYICMLIGVLFFAELYIYIKAKDWKGLAVSTLIFAFAFVVGIGIGSPNVFSNQEYAKETMRGGHSDLQKSSDEQNKTGGLDLDYATVWSYGIDETMTLLIPNFMGGASGYGVGEKSVLYKELTEQGVPKKTAKQFCEQAPTYRGDKPFTSGPVYAGAIVCFLFLLSLIIVPGPYKWALLVATIFSILLSWGRHFMPFTEVFFNYFPQYNKFRAVESILIVAEITMPLLAFMGVEKLVEDRQTNNERTNRKNLIATIISFAVTGTICLFFFTFGSSIIDFSSSYDSSLKSQLPDFAYQAILDERAAMLSADSIRSLIFILLSAATVCLYIMKKKFHTIAFAAILAALILADMWPVDKRFCNNSMFVSVKERDKSYAMLDYEKRLLQDDSHFRVLNLTTNTFNEARTSYYLKNIGGYSAAKLRRYQDLIDEHISKEMSPLMNAIYTTNGFARPINADSIFPVLNMLNMKYAIVATQGGGKIEVENPYAMGNAWFVDKTIEVNNANSECEALKHINLHKEAVLDTTFVKTNHLKQTAPDSTAFIELTEYTPKQITYRYKSLIDKTAVFSEIYYPYGWKASVDGKSAEHYRVNYMLRAIDLPAGEHTVVFLFDPDSIHKGNAICIACIAIMILTAILLIIKQIILVQRKNQ